MSPEDYVLEYEGECWACLGENRDDEYILLGDTFLRGWYSVHDHKNNRFGFVPHSESKKAAPVYGVKPETNLSENDAEKSTLMRIVGMIIPMLLVLFFIIF